jgi:hypothetical protein
MPVRLSTRVEPINRDVQVIVNSLLSPAARSKLFADFAEDIIEDTRQQNRRALGGDPKFTVTVDGRLGAPLVSVRPNGVIFVEFQLVIDVLRYIQDQLERHSPVKSGRYRRSHLLFADGTQVVIGAAAQQIVEADEYVFINSQPYARKLELGASTQAPDGVYQAVATMAQARFGNVARIRFTYRALAAGVKGRGARQPSITVRVGSGRN